MKKKILIYALVPFILAAALAIWVLPSSCKKEPMPPRVTTSLISGVTETTALCGGIVESDGGASVTERGVCWSIGETPATAGDKTTDGQGTGSFASNLTGLTPNTFYRVRGYAINSKGTSYGSILTFHTWSGSISDIDGNLYHTLAIGNQVWMAENLRTKKLNDGTGILLLSPPSAWEGNTSPAYCFYENNEDAYKATYGALYNWYAVASGKLCPTGWHVPDDDEWETLIASVGDSLVSGARLKEAGTLHWASPNAGSTNEHGFTALPGGFLQPFYYSGTGGSGCGSGPINPGFWLFGSGCWWWSATQAYDPQASMRYIGTDPYILQKNWDKRSGLSVRCLKD